MARIEIVADPSVHRQRLEEFLFEQFGGLSKMYIRQVVCNEKCLVNGRNENVGYRVRKSDFIEIELDLSRETAMRPHQVDLNILYEDADLIVVDKPSGLLVHPNHRDRSGTLLNGLSYHLNAGKASSSAAVRPGLVHRLDKGTSGLMVVAKNNRVHRILAGHFQKRLVEKRYLALVIGSLAQNEGTIDAPIGRDAGRKRWDVNQDGKASRTRFWVRQRRQDTTVLELEPVTGRTNQLRIHCASVGHPIVGDQSRGGGDNDRLCLHAFRLSFRHPSTGEHLDFASPIDFLKK
jgi:23S rRNA pseudouridine1911/1915/1917 synthase